MNKWLFSCGALMLSAILIFSGSCLKKETAKMEKKLEILQKERQLKSLEKEKL